MQIDLSVFIFAPNLGNSDNAKIFPVQPHLFYAKRDIPSFFWQGSDYLPVSCHQSVTNDYFCNLRWIAFSC